MPAEAARRRIAAESLERRCECVAGDFFAAVPGGADTYVLSRILHDWQDADARRILATCGAAMAPGARLVIVEALLPEHAADRPAAIRMDLTMLLLLGAHERTEAEYRTLLASSGLAVRRVVATDSPLALSVIEAACEDLSAPN
jgi:hypothetical protein